MDGLRLVGDTLTHLELISISPLQLRDLFNTCPKLTSLRLKYVNAIPPSSDSLKYPRLTHLALHGLMPDALSKGNLIRILSIFPGLVSLQISPMPDSSFLPALQEYCPSLRTLSYGRELDIMGDVVHVKGKGITVAQVGEGSMFVQDHLITFLRQHAHTLKELDLDIHIDEDASSTWELSDCKFTRQGNPSSISFENLETLRFAEEDDSTMPCLEWIMTNAPKLESISLPESFYTTNILAPLKNVKHLKKIRINDANGYSDDGAMEQFLNHHIALGDQSTLEEVKIYFDTYDMTSVSWLPLLSQLKRLKTLHLFSEFVKGQCASFLNQLGKGCPALEHLTLGYDQANFEHGMIAAFGTHPNLKEFHIGAMDLSESELRCLADFPKLKRAYVCCPVSESITEYLRGHVQIIPLYRYQTYNDVKRSNSLDFHYDLDDIDDLESLDGSDVYI